MRVELRACRIETWKAVWEELNRWKPARTIDFVTSGLVAGFLGWCLGYAMSCGR
jgi:hypothetical protein